MHYLIPLIPFIFYLLIIIALQITKEHVWEKNYMKISSLIMLISTIYFSFIYKGYNVHFLKHLFIHDIFFDFLPFILTTLSLFSFGSRIDLGIEQLNGSFINNYFFIIVFYSILSPFIGTSASTALMVGSMSKLRIPNQFLKWGNKKTSTFLKQIIFLIPICLVCNIAGAISSIGDAPLLAGFFQGVSFFWPLKNLFFITIMLVILLLIYLFFSLKIYKPYCNLESSKSDNLVHYGKFLLKMKYKGLWPIFFIILLAIGYQLLMIESVVFSNKVLLTGCFIIIMSLLLLKAINILPRRLLCFLNNFFDKNCNINNGEQEEKIKASLVETFIILLTLFVLLSPILFFTAKNPDFINTIQSLQDQKLLFWLTFFISGFIDNTPTYLLFFKLLGGKKITYLSLKYISYGAVFGGALTPIGNAPNIFLISYLKKQGLPVFSFFFHFIISLIFLIPILFLI